MSLAKVVLITGANSGIGYEAVKVFLKAAKPYHILAAARSAEKADAAVESIKKDLPDVKNTVSPLVVDLASDDSIQAAFKQVSQSPGRLDALINNAGATLDLDYNQGKVSMRENFNRTYDANVTGAGIMADTFMPLLLESSDARLLFVAGLSSITDFDAGDTAPTKPYAAGWPKEPGFNPIAYRCSKVALNMLTLDYAFRLKKDAVKVWGVAPGMLATNLGGAGPEAAKAMGAGHASIGGELYLAVVEGKRDADEGKVIKKGGLLAL